MKVSLVGAGPYDSGLMTVKGLKALENADVVLYDRLVGEEIISKIPLNAERINVGKNTNNHPVPQHEINQLLLSKALEGLNVVRLKGGDPFVFGRGGEELELLVENNIPFEVIPGVSSSVAAGAYAGIPVTHRDYASSLHIITGHAKAGGSLNINFEALAKLNGTLVFMMSVSSLGEICQGLLDNQMTPDTPAAIIENATSTRQRKFVGTIKTLPDMAKANNVVSPSVIIVGKVCTLSQQFAWFDTKPLHNTKILVTRPKLGESKLTPKLKELGCDVIEFPCIHIKPMSAGNELLESSLGNINGYSWLVFTSGNGVNIFFDHLISVKFDIRKLHSLKIAVVGTETEKEVVKRGLTVDYIPEKFCGEALGHGLSPLIQTSERLLVIRGVKGCQDILDVFDKNSVSYDNVGVYETLYQNNDSQHVQELIDSSMLNYVTFTSASTVEGFVNTMEGLDFSKVKGVCIGKRTESEAKKHGIQTFTASQATLASMVELIKELEK